MWTFDHLLEHVAHAQLPVTADSRAVTPGGVFVAVPGTRTDGTAFIPQAIAAGAAFVVCKPEVVSRCQGITSIEAVSCENPRKALGQLAAARYRTSRPGFPLVGVTGTNGKTTVTYLLDHLFASAGHRTGVLGTVAYRWPGFEREAPMTTPDATDLHAMVAAMGQAGVTAAFMEVSSHALDQDRVEGLPFAGAVFTNLTQDHLDYHGSFADYFEAKARLFTQVPPADKLMVIDVDHEWGLALYERVRGAAGLVGYGLSPRPAGVDPARYLHGELMESGPAGLRMRVTYGDAAWQVVSPLIGAYNAENLLAAQAVGLGLGLTAAHFSCFEQFCGVPGRLERIVNPQGLNVFVDYAHTPDALVNMLTAVRGAGFARVVCVFGCGGNRDRTKRPLMGEAVARLADVAVLTSDNPRHEDPEAILADVLPGLAEARETVVEVDRRKAIEKALALLQPGDALVVAGKGHENTQQVGDVKYPFSDQQTIRELLGCA